MTSIQTTLTELNRVGTCMNLTKIVIGSLMDAPNHFQVVVKDFVEIPILLPRLSENHRKV